MKYPSNFSNRGLSDINEIQSQKCIHLINQLLKRYPKKFDYLE